MKKASEVQADGFALEEFQRVLIDGRELVGRIWFPNGGGAERAGPLQVRLVVASTRHAVSYCCQRGSSLSPALISATLWAGKLSFPCRGIMVSAQARLP